MPDFRRYAEETRFTLRIGASPADGLRLAAETARFHLGNARGPRGHSAPRRHRVRLLNRPHDLWLRTRSGDLFVLYDVFLSRCYVVPLLDLSNARLIVDLGANVGLTALFLAGLAPRARLVCVEPSPENAALLRLNLAAVADSVVVEAAAGRTGRLAFDADGPAWGGGLSPRGRIEVDGLGMDDLLAVHAPEGRVDLLKMDIEGGEAEVLREPGAWLDRVDCVVAELHPPFGFERFRDLLQARGFEVYAEGDGGCALPTAIRPGARCARALNLKPPRPAPPAARGSAG